jgi:paraquat-inducible protein A
MLNHSILLRIANLALLVLFPISWFMPLLEVGLMPELNIPWKFFGKKIPPLFGLENITVISGIQLLWKSDVYLALLVSFFALFSPIIKVLGTSLIQFNLLSSSLKPYIEFLGKLAMADIFIISIFISKLKFATY